MLQAQRSYTSGADAAAAPARVGLRGAGPLQAKRRLTPAFRRGVGPLLVECPDLVYGILVAAWLGAALAGTLAYAAARGAAWPVLLLLAALAPPILLDFVLLSVREILVRVYPRRTLPRATFSEIPDSCRTLVVVPTLLFTPRDAQAQLARLERLAASHPGVNLRFALLSDFPDAPQPVMPGDAAVLEAAALAVAGLNARHRDAAGDKFFVLHRERRWNESERCWIGWERKRGKLEELNRLLREPGTLTTYAWILGDFRRACVDRRVRYVVTLDEDTWLPPGHLAELVRTAAHPLNRPRYDRAAGRVVEGYGILAARVRSVPPRALSSQARPTRFLALTFGVFRSARRRAAGASPGVKRRSIRPSREFSFDVFGHGQYFGKGLYDVDAFRAALDGTFPSDTVLSHDHLEGYLARVGYLHDVFMVEPFPPRFATRALQLHRWMRGDCQVLPWLLPRVRDAGGSRRRNPLPVPYRLEVLRRVLLHLHAPASLSLVLSAWLWLPGGPAAWSCLAFLVSLAPLTLLAAVTLVHSVGFVLLLVPMLLGGAARAAARELAAAWGTLADHALRTAFTIATLADSALLAADAVARALWRMGVSRRGLLEWNVQRVVESGTGDELAGYLRAMWPGAATGLLTLALVAGVAPGRLAWAAPVAGLWALAPALVWWLDRAPAARSVNGIVEDQNVQA